MGVLMVVLHLPEGSSLKFKRQVVSGLLRRIRSEFNVAAAEVGNGDAWQLAELGIACVSNDPRHADEVLARVLRFVETRSLDAVVSSVSTELIRV